MKHNPDDRRDNVERIQENIDHTIRNIELGEEMIRELSDDETKQEISEKNERRRAALEGMRHEIREEAIHRHREK